MELRLVPRELLSLIPKFEGEETLLNLFIKKAQYIHAGFATETAAQALYVYHSITSRLTGRAAALVSEREDINSWDDLKELLIQHFGDPRSEECIAIELEQLKIKSSESYIDFCHRIQQMRSTLFAKVNLISDAGVKAAKMIVYNNMALNVFLYNLSEDLIRIVRLKQCSNLETALSIVMEEVNFLNQYNAKKRQIAPPQHFKPQMPIMLPNSSTSFKFGNPQTPQQNKFQLPSQNFKFGIPHQQQVTNKFGSSNMQPANNWRFNNNQGTQNYRFGMPNQQQNFRFGIPQQNFRFGIPQQGQGFRPQMNNFVRPQGFQPQLQNNFKFGIPNQNIQNQKPAINTDVSMRTARPLRQNMLDAPYEADSNNVFYNNEVETCPEYYPEHETEQCNENYMYNLDTPQFEAAAYTETSEMPHQEVDAYNNENFQAQASNIHLR